MSLAPGTRIGAYEIRDSLGAGGMGEVYRARDTRLNRDVAIKVLPEALANDPEGLLRLQREAQVLASLNHPNIAIVHGFEEGPAPAGHYPNALVMELVDGPTRSVCSSIDIHGRVNHRIFKWPPTGVFSSSSRLHAQGRRSRWSLIARRR
jgi:serine/threonine protein kinase